MYLNIDNIFNKVSDNMLTSKMSKCEMEDSGRFITSLLMIRNMEIM